MKTNTKQTPLDAYMQKHAHIAEMIKRLQGASDDHFFNNPDNIGWGHVADLGATETALQELSDRVFREGEYVCLHANASIIVRMMRTLSCTNQYLNRLRKKSSQLKAIVLLNTSPFYAACGTAYFLADFKAFRKACLSLIFNAWRSKNRLGFMHPFLL